MRESLRDRLEKELEKQFGKNSAVVRCNPNSNLTKNVCEYHVITPY